MTNEHDKKSSDGSEQEQEKPQETQAESKAEQEAHNHDDNVVDGEAEQVRRSLNLHRREPDSNVLQLRGEATLLTLSS